MQNEEPERCRSNATVSGRRHSSAAKRPGSTGKEYLELVTKAIEKGGMCRDIGTSLRSDSNMKGASIR